MDETLRKRLEILTAGGRAQSLDFEGVAARVATDRFLAIEAPDAEACARFEEMMLGALAHVDAATAQRIAEKLGPCPAAPSAVLARLIALGPDSAARVLAAAPGLPAALLLERATSGEAREAVVIARRADIDMTIVGALARRLEPEVLRALATNTTTRIDRGALFALIQRARVDLELGRLLLARADTTFDRTMLFLSADTSMRRGILLDATRGSLAGADDLARMLDAARFDALGAAEAGDLTRFSTILARALRVARSAIERLALDAGGEPFALFFAAMGLSATESQRPILSLRSDLAAALADPMSGTRLALQAPPRAAGAILAALLPGRPRPATAGEYAQRGARAQESGAPALGATTAARAVNRA
ncbi:MAG: DUF2336 domain-containing protein [Methylobacteriaceae bacterium]|nr:DUF2336 domain-containing protein [Methylobacteriaceae bacterium]